MAIVTRGVLAAVVLSLVSLACAGAVSRLSASGWPIVIEGFTPGARYSLSVYGRVAYLGTVGRPLSVYRDACFEYDGPGFPTYPGTPAAVFQNDFGVEVCGVDPRYQDGGYRTLERVEFVAPRERMVAWMVPPNLPERELVSAGWQSLQVFVRALDRQHVGPPPEQLNYCLLRRPLSVQPTSGPPLCFEFRRAYAFDVANRLVEVDFDTCRLTDRAIREGWELDPTFGGPYGGYRRAEEAYYLVTPHPYPRPTGDFYGCRGAPRALPGPAPFDPRGVDPDVLAAYGVFAANSCPWAFDGECDEPGIGTGVCAAGTDTFDCWGVAFDWSNSCPWAFDGECDEPGIGTGACLPGTDTFDCGFASFDWSNSCPWAFDGECDEPIIGTGVCLPGTDTFDCDGAVLVAPAPAPTPAPPTPEPPLPNDVERRERALDACDVWSVANSGGAEGTVDVWDIRAIPDGAVFDLRFDARSEPDRYRVAYAGVQVYDSGWRGASHYDGDARFDGGVAGPGRGEALDLFVKRGHAQFTVTVVGGTSTTVWDYRVRCRLP